MPVITVGACRVHARATCAREPHDVEVTWKPAPAGANEGRSDLPDSAFAFPRERKEPLTDAAHVRSAIARFSAVKNVDDGARRLAFANIKAAAGYYGVEVSATSWHDLVG